MGFKPSNTKRKVYHKTLTQTQHTKMIHEFYTICLKPSSMILNSSGFMIKGLQYAAVNPITIYHFDSLPKQIF